MSLVLDDLVSLLSMEQIEENLFRGLSQDLGFRQLFGGQVLGQCVSAASQTVDAARHVHSLHGYFLRPGDAAMPVVYSVDRVRDAFLVGDRAAVGAFCRIAARKVSTMAESVVSSSQRMKGHE